MFIWLPGRLVTEGYGFVRGYGFLVLLALAQVPGYALAAVGIETIGRRRTLVAFLVASAAGCLLFVLAGEPLWIAAALLAMSFALLGTWGALYAYTPELYPTELRATGMGVAGAMARVGGLLAPSAIALVVGAGFAHRDRAVRGPPRGRGAGGQPDRRGDARAAARPWCGGGWRTPPAARVMAALGDRVRASR